MTPTMIWCAVQAGQHYGPGQEPGVMAVFTGPGGKTARPAIGGGSASLQRQRRAL